MKWFNDMAFGDLIYVPSYFHGIRFLHFGIDLGNGQVVHLSSERGDSEEAGQPKDSQSTDPCMESGDSSNDEKRSVDRVGRLQTMEVRCTSLASFANGQAIRIAEVASPLDPEETCRRARMEVGKQYYHLTEKNCEHFARWCKTGTEESFQVESVRASVACFLRTSTKAAKLLAARRAVSASATAVLPKLAVGRWIPAAIACDLVDFSVAESARCIGVPSEKAKQYGWLAGCASAGIVGFFAGGPVGTTAMIGLQIASSQIADRVVDRTSAHLGNWFSRD